MSNKVLITNQNYEFLTKIEHMDARIKFVRSIAQNELDEKSVISLDMSSESDAIPMALVNINSYEAVTVGQRKALVESEESMVKGYGRTYTLYLSDKTVEKISVGTVTSDGMAQVLQDIIAENTLNISPISCPQFYIPSGTDPIEYETPAFVGVLIEGYTIFTMDDKGGEFRKDDNKVLLVSGNGKDRAAGELELLNVFNLPAIALLKSL